MATRGNGGIIGPANVPTNQVATGVWNLEEQQAAKGLNAWPSDYRIARSLRFNSADSAYLNRTPASASNQKTWTWSAWVKLSEISPTGRALFVANIGGFYVYGNQLLVYFNTSPATNVQTSGYLRDFSAWYHFVVSADTTQATASDRIKIYVNNQLQPLLNTNYPPQNSDLGVNSANQHFISTNYAPELFNGYMTEVNFIDGQALTPSSFGTTNPDTGVWQPKPYAGTYGTNGFYLNFSDNSNTTATTLGKDYSGNGNNWTPNNFSVSAGAGNDSLVDVPTAWGTDTGVGGEVRGNYATFNPLFVENGSATYANGNLDGTSVGAKMRSTIAIPPNSKIYAEFVATSLPNFTWIGVVNAAPGGDEQIIASGNFGANDYAANDVIGIAVDTSANTVVFYKNGTLFTPKTTVAGATYFFACYGLAATTFIVNFGQRPFAYPAPAGFKALCTQNLPTPTIGATAATVANKYFDATLFTGTGAPLTVVNAGGFQPDLVWTKNRSSVAAHYLTNVLSGVSQYLSSDSASAELTGTQLYTSFNSNGFSMGTSGYPNGAAVVAWQWKAGGTGVTNTSGSVASTVSANTTSGFSVVTWTCPAGASDVYTVGHGLGAAPKMIIIKSRNAAYNWFTWHIGLGDNTTDYVALNLTNAEASSAGMWGAVGRNSAVMGFTNGVSTIANNTMVAYVFSEVPGFSKFGSYTSNNSADGPFLYCGFRPAYVMIKNTTDPNASWIVYDNKRNTANVETNWLLPNASNAEGADASLVMDFTSNGIKIRGNGLSINFASNSYIFAAFAEAPQKFALAR